MSIPEGSVTDSGHVIQTQPADNWIAVFAVSYEPYHVEIPIALWAVVKRDGVEYRDALVPLYGNPTLQLLSVVANSNFGVFLGHCNLPLQTHATLTDSAGNNIFTQIVSQATKLGKDWAEQMRQPASNL